MQPHFKCQPTDAFIFHDRDLFLGHKALILFRKPAIQVEFRDRFQNTVAHEFQALVGLLFQRQAVRRALQECNIKLGVLYLRAARIRTVHECAFIQQ